ncbi:MAG: hypothetical protein DRO06_02305, partial [Thermoproteota archaeon]
MLAGRVVVVTGGTSGIGRAVALGAAGSGADVAVIGRSRERGEEVVSRASSLGVKATFHEADVSSAEQVERAFSEVGEEHGRVDCLVTAAGVYASGPADSMPLEEWDRVLDVNLRGTYLAVRYALPLMREGSSIVTVASTAGISPYARGSAYCASKAGVIAL